jgi:hypothetical protein
VTISRADYIAQTVAAAPPLSNEVIDYIAVLLSPQSGAEPGPRIISQAEAERQRIETERVTGLEAAKRLSASLMACDICDLPPEAHDAQQRYGAFHEWQPGRAEKVMKRKAKR